MMRLFIAVEIPEEVKLEIAERAKGLSGLKNIRAVKPEHMHVTIAFLGEREDADKILEKLKKIRFSKFTLRLSNYGFFPSDEKIRVMWVGIERNDEYLNLQKQIRDALDHREKIMPHLTIGRSKFPVTEEREPILAAMRRFSDFKAEFEVVSFALFKSTLTQEGPIHEKIRDFRS